MSKTLLNLLLITIIIATYFLVISPIYFGGGYFYQVPNDQSIVVLSEFKNKNELALKHLNEGLAKTNSLKMEYDAVDEATKNKLNIIIPNSIDKVRLVNEITNFVKSSGLPVNNIMIAKEDEDKKINGVGVYSISFSTECSYFNLKQLLAKIESSMRLLSVQTIDFSPKSNNSDIMVVNIKMNTYYFK